MTNNLPAEVFPPGEFLREELDARGWTQTDLAEILGRPPRLVNEIIAGKRAVTPETAKGLADAFGTTPELWLNLESSYQLWRLEKRGGSDPAVARRSLLRSCFPLKELLRRRWIEPSNNIDVLEQRVLDYFEIKSLDDKPMELAHAAKKSTTYAAVTMEQSAWLRRARRLAKGVEAAPFTETTLNRGLDALRMLRANAEDVRRIPSVLAEMGIRFVIVEALSGSRIDGACFWLGEKAPAIAVSLRYDRIDSFWFAVMHEVGHAKQGDGMDAATVDEDLVGEHAVSSDRKPPVEREADRFAAEFLLPQAKLRDFVARVRPFYSKAKIRGFAALNQVHPGLVVGQLQHAPAGREQGEIPYSNHREMLVRIRQALTDAAITDGWGATPIIPS